MMRFFSRLVRSSGKSSELPKENLAFRNGTETASYESELKIQSTVMRVVTFTINRISFGRRMELARRVREISRRVEFLDAGNQVQEKIEANLLRQEIEATYLRWGLVRIDGLTIDGQPATAERLLDKGPEELAQEIVRAIKAQCGLSDDERKN